LNSSIVLPFYLQGTTMTDLLSNVFLVIVGWLLGLLSAVALDWRQDRRQARRIRAMLIQEIDHNLTLVSQLQKEAEDMLRLIQSSTKNREEQVILLKRLYDLPFVAWTKTIWEGHQAIMPAVLQDRQISAVLNFFTALDRITAMREQIARIDKTPAADIDDPNRSVRYMGLSSVLYDEPRELAVLLVNLIQELTTNGNPLRRT